MRRPRTPYQGPPVVPGRITRPQYDAARNKLVALGKLKVGITDQEVGGWVTAVRSASGISRPCQGSNFSAYLKHPQKRQPHAFRRELHRALRLDQFGLDDDLWNAEPAEIATQIERSVTNGVRGFLLQQPISEMLVLREVDGIPLRAIRIGGSPKPVIPMRQELIVPTHTDIAVAVDLPAASHLLLLAEEGGVYKTLNGALQVSQRLYSKGSHVLGQIAIEQEPARSTLFLLTSDRPLKPEWIYPASRSLSERETLDLLEKIVARPDARVAVDIVSLLAKSPTLVERPT